MPQTATKKGTDAKPPDKVEKSIPPQWEFDGMLVHAKTPLRRAKRTVYPEDFKLGDVKKSYGPDLATRLAGAQSTCKKPKGVEVFFIRLSPDLARFLILYRGANRKLKKQAIEGYVTDIEKGLWTVTGQPIILDNHGRLIDGQQRCAAVIESDKAITVLVVMGVPTKRFDDVDTGAGRTLPDMMAAVRDKGGFRIPFCTTVASAVILAVKYSRLLKSKSGCIARKKIKQHWGPRLWKAMPEFSDAALIYLNDEVKNGLRRYGITASVAVGSMLFTYNRDAAKSDEFWNLLATGDGLSKKSPITALRNFLLDYVVTGDAKPKAAQEWALDVLIQAWNLFVAGKTAAKGLMRTEPGRPFPQFAKSQKLMRRILKEVMES
jgi:hypothetical protein